MTKERPTAIHTLILETFETRILSGQWHTGYRIPTEHEIAAEYGCSRPTVAKALLLLEQKGMIERRKRAGTFVKRPPSQSIILQILDPETEITARGAHHRYEMIAQDIRTATSADRKALHIRQGRVIAVTMRHWADDAVYCAETRVVNLELLPDAEHVDFTRTPVNDWLMERVPWRSGDYSIGADAASDELAERLEIALGAPLMSIERWVYTSPHAKEFVSHAYTWYPVGQQRLKAHYEIVSPYS